ncbi:hypothetical protein [Bdellovibrio sp.]|uniref:hypothetical protein n=1 Tax=Bdellovibrio sp. TaxID=28201 RepID=UPI0039E5B543
MFTLLVVSSFLSACSLDATLLKQEELISTIENLNRKEPDFIPGEVVTTAQGYRVKAVFGEITEKNTTTNGWKIEGVFYE